MHTKTIASLLGLWALGWAGSAQAGGYDTPMLYSARHMGMGGAAVGYVRDPSAMFHNPAGLAHTRRASVLADFTLLVGSIQGSPTQSQLSIDAETTVAPLGLVGGAYRITDWLTAGFAVFPVAAAGATYEYPSRSGAPVRDSTTLVFIEATPGVSFDLPHNIRLGAGWRITTLSVDREIVAAESDPSTQFTLTGTSFASFRAGAQWTAVEDLPDATATERRSLQIGAAYRHKTSVEVSDDEGRVLNVNVENLQSEFVLPARLSFGVRGDVQRFGAAVDFEYALQSQNDTSVISAEMGGSATEVPNLFRWKDSITLRGGLEYRLLDRGELATRLGYVFDAQTANPRYPTAFGTPPGDGHVFTAGAGYDGGDWEANLAYGYRVASGEVTAAEVAPADECRFCGREGDYELSMHGMYVDFSYDFE